MEFIENLWQFSWLAIIIIVIIREIGRSYRIKQLKKINNSKIESIGNYEKNSKYSISNWKKNNKKNL